MLNTVLQKGMTADEVAEKIVESYPGDSDTPLSIDGCSTRRINIGIVRGIIAEALRWYAENGAK